MSNRSGDRLVNMVHDPYKWYSPRNFAQVEAKRIYRAMEEDEHHLMSVDDRDRRQFLGGYILGYTIRERMGTRDLIRRLSKEQQYVDPLRLAHVLEIHPNDLPETVHPAGLQERPLVERVVWGSNGESTAYKIHVSSLAYLNISAVRRVSLADLPLSELIRKGRLTGDERYRAEFLEKVSETIQMLIMEYLRPSMEILGMSELMDIGQEGASEVFDRYDFERGIKVETYMPNRILGAMQDYLRIVDPVSRAVRDTVNEIRTLLKSAREDGERLTIDNLVDLTGRSKATVERAYAVVTRNADKPVSLNATMGKDDDRPMIDNMKVEQAHYSASPLDQLASREAANILLATLSPDEQEIVVDCICNGTPMKTVGENVGLSESRISQMVSGLLHRLRYEAQRRGISPD